MQSRITFDTQLKMEIIKRVSNGKDNFILFWQAKGKLYRVNGVGLPCLADFLPSLAKFLVLGPSIRHVLSSSESRQSKNGKWHLADIHPCLTLYFFSVNEVYVF